MRTENDYETMTDSELAVKGLFNHLKSPLMWRREVVRRIRRLHDEVLPFRLATKGAKDVLAERQRQVDELNWSAAHDDGHTGYELAKAAFCYLQWCIKPDLDREASLRASKSTGYSPYRWPFSSRWWKPRDRRSDLVRAAAFCMAEIDRLDRIEDREKSEAELPAAVKFGLLFSFAEGDDEEPESGIFPPKRNKEDRTTVNSIAKAKYHGACFIRQPGGRWAATDEAAEEAATGDERVASWPSKAEAADEWLLSRGLGVV